MLTVVWLAVAWWVWQRVWRLGVGIGLFYWLFDLTTTITTFGL